MRPVNLIPSDHRRGDSAPLRTGVTSYGVVGALALVLAGIVAVVFTNNQIADSKSERADLEARQQVAQQQAAALAPYGEFASLSEDRRTTVTSLARSRFDWERVLNELARVIPDDVWLEHLTGTVAPGVSIGSSGSSSSTAASDATTMAGVTGPSLEITGCAVGQEAVARFVASLKDIDGVTRVGLSRSALGDEQSSGAATTDSATTAGSTSAGSCQTKQFIAAFEITVAFDAVPVSQYAASSSSATAVPAATSTSTSTTSTTTTSTTDDGGVAATQTEQQGATDSAAQQTSEAQQGASAVGMGG